MLIHTCHVHATLCRGLEKSFQNGMVVAWHERGMACVKKHGRYV
jgi:hypothetical protein